LQKILNDYYMKNGNGIIVQALHRLDRETTGLVAFSKSPVFQPLFDKMIAEKKIQRNYLAIVNAKVPKKKKYTFTEKIGKDRHDSSKRVVSANGKDAKTAVISLETYLDYSLIKCTLDTGRTHQIRIHLSFHRMPIINDQLYGKNSNLIQNMGLFGNELLFEHPITHEKIHLKASLGREINSVIKMFS